MKAILDEMLAALSRGERVVLCSILASSGSVPRGAGAKMAVFEDDRVLGTIGGGTVERLSIQRAQDALKNGGSNELKSYNLHPSEVASTGMICGGAVTVYFQFFAPEQAADIAVLKRWREMLDKDVDLWLLLSLDGDGVNEFHVVTREEIPQDKADYFSAKAVWKNGIYVEPLCHAGSVYIFGGGHVGRALVPVLATRDFMITPQFLKQRYKIPPEHIEFPIVEERAALSEPETVRSGTQGALMARSSFASFAGSVVAARGLRSTAILCICIALVGSILGAGLMFVLTFLGADLAASCWNLLLYTVLWLIPELLITSMTAKR